MDRNLPNVYNNCLYPSDARLPDGQGSSHKSPKPWTDLPAGRVLFFNKQKLNFDEINPFSTTTG